MSKRKKVDKNDKFRILLTDVLPYEVPLPFTNFYYHALLRKQANNLPNELYNDIVNAKYKFYIPYNFTISTENNSIRKLSVPHPAIQYHFCEFYNEYADLILEYCNVSSFSLRYPYRIAYEFYEKEDSNKNVSDDSLDLPQVEQEEDILPVQTKVASSFFSYRPYNMQYKFFESYEFIELEKKYKYMATFDVHKCFYNIYTHTLSWAVKSKEFAKKNKGSHSFEEIFDSHMMDANYNETHGIIVGPEFSRIFAEIIFQKCDVNIEKKLFNNNLQNEVDYTIRRYVDDYFVFANNEDTINLIKNVIQEELEIFKLYLNVHKSNIQKRPFITGLSTAKMSISQSIELFFESINKFITDDYFVNLKASKKMFIDNIRSVSSSYDVPIEHYTKFCLSIITKKSLNIYKNNFSNDSKPISSNKLYLLHCHILDIIFYLYSLDGGVRSTYIMSKFIIFSRKMLYNHDDYVLNECDRLFFQHITNFLRHSINSKQYGSIEVLNILVVLREFSDDYLLSEKLLSRLFGLNDDYDFNQLHYDFGYFQILILFYYIRDNNKYQNLKNALYDYLLNIFDDYEKRNILPNDCEAFMLFFDIISCPWISEDIKRDICRNYIKSSNGQLKNINKLYDKSNRILKFISKHYWFFDWSSYAHIDTLLDKKELKIPY